MFASAPLSKAQTSKKVATLDWALLETLLALKADVVAAPELRQFRQVAVAPDIPDTVADIGLRGLPNLETLFFSKPDVIFNSNFYAWADPLLERIAPTHNLGIYIPGASPYVMAEQAMLGIAYHLGMITVARNYISETAQRLDDLRRKLARQDRQVILPINLGDARHYRVFGADSMFGNVLEKLDLENAWKGATAYSATAPIGIETLASFPEAWIVLIPPHPEDALAELKRSAFWNALPSAMENRVVTIGSMNPYGSLPAARRFAEELSRELTNAWKA